ncbi:MAG TPA: 50S ribosomal protein L24 [Candidatus Nanoarchaeia archaeon]|nr:50S ribosomal protein L24 [Candidatus Nanoarchaeia archaeon]
MKAKFSTSWKGSAQVRKQRKYRHNAPLHLKQKMLHGNLSKPLREKYGLRNMQIRKGDKVKILRGQFKKKEGKVDRVDLKDEKIFVTGLEIIKKDGNRILQGISPSNAMIIELELSDHKRKMKVENKKINKTKKQESK